MLSGGSRALVAKKGSAYLQGMAKAAPGVGAAGQQAVTCCGALAAGFAGPLLECLESSCGGSQGVHVQAGISGRWAPAPAHLTLLLLTASLKRHAGAPLGLGHIMRALEIGMHLLWAGFSAGHLMNVRLAAAWRAWQEAVARSQEARAKLQVCA